MEKVSTLVDQHKKNFSVTDFCFLGHFGFRRVTILVARWNGLEKFKNRFLKSTKKYLLENQTTSDLDDWHLFYDVGGVS